MRVVGTWGFRAQGFLGLVVLGFGWFGGFQGFIFGAFGALVC